LIAGADAVLGDESMPRVPAVEGLVCCRVSAWGGASDLPSDEALVAAASGVHAMQWSWSRRPVWLVTPVVAYMTGMLAALGVAAAVFARRRGAPGQAVGVSGLRAAFALNSGTYVTGPETRGSLSQFGDPRGQMPTYSLFRTADGWLFIGALTPTFLVKLMTVLERVDLLADPRLEGSPLAFGVPEIKDFVRRELDPILATRTTAEWLGVLGAEVLQAEAADGDPFRMAACGFVGWNRGKRSLVLDLKRAEGREVFLDLARRADVVVDNFRAGVMERLGLGWETLHDVNPLL